MQKRVAIGSPSNASTRSGLFLVVRYTPVVYHCDAVDEKDTLCRRQSFNFCLSFFFPSRLFRGLFFIISCRLDGLMEVLPIALQAVHVGRLAMEGQTNNRQEVWIRQRVRSE